jgi:hypothetical protein
MKKKLAHNRAPAKSIDGFPLTERSHSVRELSLGKVKSRVDQDGNLRLEG